MSTTATITSTVTTTTFTISPPPPQPVPVKTAPKLTLPSLPIDVLFALSSHMDYASIMYLSQTCRSLYSTLNADKLASLSSRQEFYQKAEHFPQHAHEYVCFTCWKFLPVTYFGDTQRTKRQGKFTKREKFRQRRVCFPCAAVNRKYQHMMPVRKLGVKYYPCHPCGIFLLENEKEGHKCYPRDDSVSLSRTSEGKDSVENFLLPPKKESPFERLPLDLQKKIFGYSQYGDLLKLKQTSRYFHQNLNPGRDCPSIFSKWNFLQEVSKDKNRRRPGHYETYKSCHGCFRVLGSGMFYYHQWWLSDEDARDRPGGSRKCYDCFRDLHHPLLKDKERLERFNRGKACQWCDCLRDTAEREEDCEGCVVHKVKSEGRKRVRDARQAQRAETEVEIYILWSPDEENTDIAGWFGEVETEVLGGMELTARVEDKVKRVRRRNLWEWAPRPSVEDKEGVGEVLDGMFFRMEQEKVREARLAERAVVQEEIDSLLSPSGEEGEENDFAAWFRGVEEEVVTEWEETGQVQTKVKWSRAQKMWEWSPRREDDDGGIGLCLENLWFRMEQEVDDSLEEEAMLALLVDEGAEEVSANAERKDQSVSVEETPAAVADGVPAEPTVKDSVEVLAQATSIDVAMATADEDKERVAEAILAEALGADNDGEAGPSVVGQQSMQAVVNAEYWNSQAEAELFKNITTDDLLRVGMGTLEV
ncbi:hypothetical protein QBC35DRAFT_501470 [Podospora australis]|uniref:F-box domain-containing protein n=1 Tax=Podospora australis TaxID=1536484 RepID=A0AAN7AF92_9PEZI|nr:hypothetical protein QBC35DRAFT_501470 [Podospora australis]